MRTTVCYGLLILGGIVGGVSWVTLWTSAPERAGSLALPSAPHVTLPPHFEAPPQWHDIRVPEVSRERPDLPSKPTLLTITEPVEKSSDMASPATLTAATVSPAAGQFTVTLAVDESIWSKLPPPERERQTTDAVVTAVLLRTGANDTDLRTAIATSRTLSGATRSFRLGSHGTVLVGPKGTPLPIVAAVADEDRQETRTTSDVTFYTWVYGPGKRVEVTRAIIIAAKLYSEEFSYAEGDVTDEAFRKSIEYITWSDGKSKVGGRKGAVRPSYWLVPDQAANIVRLTRTEDRWASSRQEGLRELAEQINRKLSALEMSSHLEISPTYKQLKEELAKRLPKEKSSSEEAIRKASLKAFESVYSEQIRKAKEIARSQDELRTAIREEIQRRLDTEAAAVRSDLAKSGGDDERRKRGEEFQREFTSLADNFVKELTVKAGRLRDEVKNIPAPSPEAIHAWQIVSGMKSSPSR